MAGHRHKWQVNFLPDYFHPADGEFERICNICLSESGFLAFKKRHEDESKEKFEEWLNK